jgi:hypothetical protein
MAVATFKGAINCYLDVNVFIQNEKIVSIDLDECCSLDTKEELKSVLDLISFTYEKLDEIKDLKENRIYKIEEDKK